MDPSDAANSAPTILVVGSINADLIAYLDDSKRIGNYVFGEDFRFNLGGKGLNQAVNVASSGQNVILVGRVGDDSFGHEILRKLAVRGVSTEHIVCDRIAHTGIGHVRVNRFGEYDTVVINGANSFLDNEQIDTVALLDLNISYVLMNYEILSGVVEYAANIFRKLGARTIINLSPITDGVTYSVSAADYLITNMEEAQAALRVSESDPAKLVQLLKEKGAKNVVITRGSKGVLGVDLDGNSFSLEREPINVENSIGAGDTFLAIFAVALNAGCTFRESLEVANFAAAKVCTKKESFLSQLEVSSIVARFNIAVPRKLVTQGGEQFHD